MITLDKIAKTLGINYCQEENPIIVGISENSKKISKGYLFVAVKGHNFDGHNYVNEALKNGAVAVLSEDFNFKCQVPILVVKDIRLAMAKGAALIYNYPTKELITIGLTGTNGKTSTAYILEDIFKFCGLNSGVMGTINFRWQDKVLKTENTTPEGPVLQSTLKEMLGSGVKIAILEISSHSLALGRIEGSYFDTVVFTNFSQDHLDYHQTMEEYFAAKKLLFSKYLSKNSKAVINFDDEYGQKLIKELNGKILTFGFNKGADLKASDFKQTLAGLEFTVNDHLGNSWRQKSSLLGKVNVYNILAAISVAYFLEVNPKDIAQAIEKSMGAPGRLERVFLNERLVLVDYAHTPMALEKVLETCREIVAENRLFLVFGCGGDRDKSKRPLMGKVALKGADLVVITSDNPRTEDPLSIIKDIEAGIKTTFKKEISFKGLKKRSEKSYFIEPDRRKAIESAIKLMQKGDVLLIAGKGHETYQLTKKVRLEFDDKKIAQHFLQEVAA